jgi:hypothetical protein
MDDAVDRGDVDRWQPERPVAQQRAAAQAKPVPASATSSQYCSRPSHRAEVVHRSPWRGGIERSPQAAHAGRQPRDDVTERDGGRRPRQASIERDLLGRGVAAAP